MKHSTKRIIAVMACMAITILLVVLGFVLFVMLECPCANPSDKGRRGICLQQMRNLQEVTNYFYTAYEAADNLRGWKDPWKHNYNAIVADEFANASFGNVKGAPIIIWSSGPNGINENGNGDDIVDCRDFFQQVGKTNCVEGQNQVIVEQPSTTLRRKVDE